jgi:hypothetical protein
MSTPKILRHKKTGERVYNAEAVDAKGFSQSIPNYAAPETLKTGTAPADATAVYSWAADRNGFAQLVLDTKPSQRNAVQMRIAVNGATAFNLLDVGSAAAAHKYETGLVPVSAGDSVDFKAYIGPAAGTYAALFFPQREQPRKVYSTDEVLTGDIWIDGKPIYRKAFKGSIKAAINEKHDLTLANGVATLVASGGWWQDGNTNGAKISTAYAYVDSNATNSIIGGFHMRQNDLLYRSQTFYSRAAPNNNYELWVEYTKA